QATVASARQVLQIVQKAKAALDEKKDDATAAKRASSLAAAGADLDTAIKNFDAYDKYLNAPGQAGQPSVFEILVGTAALVGDTSMNYLVLSVVHLGANSGIISRALGSDNFEYMATTEVAYFLVSSEGALLQSGAVPVGVGSNMSIAEAERNISASTGYE